MNLTAVMSGSICRLSVKLNCKIIKSLIVNGG